MPWCAENTSFTLPNSESLIVRDLNNLKSINRSFSTWTHNNRHFKLSMPTNKISMIMSKHNIFQCRLSIIYELPISNIVICGVNKISLTMRLNIVSKHSKVLGFELSNIDSLLLKLWDEVNCSCCHEFVCEISIRKIFIF